MGVGVGVRGGGWGVVSHCNLMCYCSDYQIFPPKDTQVLQKWVEMCHITCLLTKKPFYSTSYSVQVAAILAGTEAA